MGIAIGLITGLVILCALIGIAFGLLRRAAKPGSMLGEPWRFETAEGSLKIPSSIWVFFPLVAIPLWLARTIGGPPKSEAVRRHWLTGREVVGSAPVSTNAADAPAVHAAQPAPPTTSTPAPNVPAGAGGDACRRAVVGVPSHLLEELRSRDDAFMDALAGAQLREGHRLAFQGLTLEILELQPGPVARVTASTELRIRATDHPTLACPECVTMPEASDTFCVGCGQPLPTLHLA